MAAQPSFKVTTLPHPSSIRSMSCCSWWRSSCLMSGAEAGRRGGAAGKMWGSGVWLTASDATTLQSWFTAILFSRGSWKKNKKTHQSATSGQQAWPLSGFRILLSKTTQYPQSFIHSNGHSDTELRTQNFSFTVVFVLLHFRLTLKNFQIWCFPTPFCSMYDLIETKVLSYSSGNQRAWNVCLMCNTALTLAKHSSQNQKTKLDRIRKPHQYRIREPSQYRIRKLSQYRIREPSQTELGNPANI